MPIDLGSKWPGNSEGCSNASAPAGITPVATVWFGPTMSDLTRRMTPPVSAASRSAARSAACNVAQNSKDRLASDVHFWITNLNIVARSTCCQVFCTCRSVRTTYNILIFLILQPGIIFCPPLLERAAREDRTCSHLKKQLKELHGVGLHIRFLFD